MVGAGLAVGLDAGLNAGCTRPHDVGADLYRGAQLPVVEKYVPLAASGAFVSAYVGRKSVRVLGGIFGVGCAVRSQHSLVRCA